MVIENGEAAKRWANQIAHYVTHALITGGVVAGDKNASAVAIIEEEIWARLCVRDYPPAMAEK